MMKTRAAVLRKGGEPWEITELDLDEPSAGEVLIRFEAAGLCHSDEHIRATGTARLPLVGDHEGAGVIEKTGPGVTRVKTGDRVACSYIPVCGTCRYCSTGHQNLCDAGKNAAIGQGFVKVCVTVRDWQSCAWRPADGVRGRPGSYFR
jgi:alcohol dehydrogenase (nicotinoprotein)